MNKYNIDWSKVQYKTITISTKDGFAPFQWTLNAPNAWGSVEVTGSRFARMEQDVDSEMRALEMKVDQSGFCDAKEVIKRIMR